MKSSAKTETRARARARVAATSALLMSLTPFAASAEQLGDVDRGQLYARAHCAECHSVEPVTGDMSPNYASPRFVDIANTPGMTERALAVSLQTPHETMPDLIIPEQDRDDLIAYILSLKLADPL